MKFIAKLRFFHSKNVTSHLRKSSSYSALKKPAYYNNVGKSPLVFQTLGQKLDTAAEIFSNTEAIVSCHEARRYTFSSLRDEVDRLAAGFVRLGLSNGDRVGIWAPNNLHWYLTMLAAARAGLVSVGINPAFQAPELDFCLKKVGVKAIVAPEVYKTQRFYEMLDVLCPELANAEPGAIKSTRLPHLKTVIIDSDTQLPGAFRFNDVLSIGDTSNGLDAVRKLQSRIEPDSVCNIQFTSGSTGQPKAAMLSHFGIVNNSTIIGSRYNLKGQRFCVHVPFFHVFGVVASIAAGVCLGATIVLPAAGFDPAESLKAIVNERCSIIYGTPTMFVDLIRASKKLEQPVRTAKTVVIGGSPSSPKLLTDIKDALGVETIGNVFGMTEATAVAFQSMSGDVGEKVLNTVGRVHDHLEAKIIDDNGNTVGFGEPGELCVRGYTTMMGYYEDDEKTKEALGKDRWLKTGDQFVLYEDGYGQIVGRIKDMIIRGGENIFPKEVEDCLNTHPDILESHAVGVEDERMGEEICAFIRLRDGLHDFTQEDVKKYCKGKIAHYKVPRYVHVVTDFPKTGSGKIQKFKLKEIFQKLKQK